MRKRQKFIFIALTIGGTLWVLGSATGLYFIAELLGNDIIVWEGPKIVLINDVTLLIAILATGTLIGLVTFIVLILLIVTFINRKKPID